MMAQITRYTLEQYNKALELKTEGYGSQRIANILGLKRRDAVEDWINKSRKPYYFSEKRILACNSTENIERLRELNKITQPKACRISAGLRIKRLPKNAKELSEELAYILGVAYCDGHISTKQRRIILSATDKEFVLKFKDKLEKWSKFKTRFYSRTLKKPDYIKARKLQYVSYIDSKEASIFLKDFDLNKISNSNNSIKCAFLKGCFDSEGCVDKNGRIIFYNTNLKLINLVYCLLKSINIISIISSGMLKNQYSKAKNIYSLTINNINNKSLYFHNIGFSIKRKQERLQDYLENK